MTELGVAFTSFWLGQYLGTLPSGDAEIDELKFDGIHDFVGLLQVVDLLISIVFTKTNVVGFEIVVNIPN